MDRIPGFGPGDGGSIPSGLVYTMNRIPIKDITDKLLNSFCETLPLNLTIFEEGGRCKRNNQECQYYEKPTTYSKKQTYTPTKELADSFSC